MRVMKYETTQYGRHGQDVHLFKDIETLEFYAIKYEYSQALYQGWLYPIIPEWIIEKVTDIEL